MVFDPDSPPPLNIDLKLGKSPLNNEAFCFYLDKYPNRADAELLKNGFSYGFHLGFVGERTSTDAHNLKSARLNSIILKEKINKEVELGRFAGPFKTPPYSNLRVSPVGLVPKSDGGWRLINHLSYPEGNSVNDGISDELSSVQYTSFDSVVNMVFQLGKQAQLAKRDLKSAFRILPISPDDFCLLGIKDNEGNFYIDKFLPMGCKISCSLFEKFSTFLDWLVKNLAKINSMDHYLDDFIFVGVYNSNQCRELVSTFSKVCSELGVPIAEEKSVEPCTKMVFLGLEIDSECMQIRIPLHKVDQLRDLISVVIQRHKITLKEFQSLVGKLSFFTKAIRSSRAFLRRCFDAMIGIKKPYHKLRITAAIRLDLSTWLTFLDSFNGVAYIPSDTWFHSDILELYTDSSGSMVHGCACFLRQEWAFFPWPESWCLEEIMKDITFLEMVPVVLALFLWGEQLSYKNVVLHIDNEALVYVINKQTSKSKRLMQLVRQFVLLTMKNGIVFKAFHISTSLNCIADSISRKQWDRFRKLAPDAKQTPKLIPESFLSMIYSLKLHDL